MTMPSWRSNECARTASRRSVSRFPSPASTSRRVREVSSRVQLPELPDARMLTRRLVDAVDPQTLWSATGRRAAVAPDQRTANGPTAEVGQDAEAPAHLRTHQAGLSAQAPYSGEDRSLGRANTWFHGSGLGLAFREFRQRRVRAHAQRDGHSYDLYRVWSGVGTR